MALRPIGLSIALTISLWNLTSVAAEAARPSPPAAATAFLTQHCADCHQGDAAEAGFDLTAIENGLDAANFERWVRAFDRVDDGEMPPADVESPDAKQVAEFLRETSQWLTEFQREETKQQGRTEARRLTNQQLERSLQSLLAIDLPLSLQMPDEPRTDGFTTVAAGQSISHFQLQHHLSVVDSALEEAFRRATAAKADDEQRILSANEVARQNPRRRCREPEMIGDDAVVWSSGLIFYGRLPATTAKHDGWYRLTIRASAVKKPADYGVWCTVRSGPCVSSAPLLNWVGAFEATDEAHEWTFEGWLPKGHMFEVRPGDRMLKRARFRGGQVGAGEGEPQDVPGVAIHQVTMQRIHRGGDQQTLTRRLFDDLRVKPASKNSPAVLISKDPTADAARLLLRFAQMAFRRPVEAQEIQHYVAAVQQSIAEGQPLIDAVRDGYRALLCSPHFLYFHETPGRLKDYAVATRLSYFLTGGPPDESLHALAADGKLTQPSVLAAQADRLLAEGRDQQFIKDFASQWLDLSKIEFTEPDPKLHRTFDVIVQNSMLAETETFLTEMLRQDHPTAHLIESDYTFLNGRLARFYGRQDIQGDVIQQVALREQDHRGGVITQGAILKVTANGSTTSPVIRGVWLSERLLGQPIPSPPKSVPAIEPDIRGAKSIREMLDKHRSDSSCASCHVKIDPPGFALENYDPAGLWRDHYPLLVGRSVKKGALIDASYELPDGSSFDDIRGFRQRVLQHPESIARNVAEHLIVYGTGASIRFSDRQPIEAIVQSTQPSDYGFRSILKAVVTSDLFLTK